MSKEIEILHQIGYQIDAENFERIKAKHRYIGDKLILDAIHGVKEVASDLNSVSKSKERGFSRFMDTFSGKSKKRQNLINENFIKGFEAISDYLLDHDRHLTRIDKRITTIANELIDTQNEILKFSQNVNFRLEYLEQFQKNAIKKFEEIEYRLTSIQAHQQVDREVVKINRLDLPIVFELFTILDNLASGDAGLYYMQEKNNTKKKDFLDYIKNKLYKEMDKHGLETFIDYKKLNLEIQKLDSYEQETIAFISGQHRIFSNKTPLYDAVDLMRVISTISTDKIDNELSKKSHIREFITLKSFIDDASNELFKT